MSRGFSLIEALVAITVLSLGLLGAAGLLLGSLRDQSRTLRQGAALQLVTDVAERVRANPAAGSAYATATSPAGDPACDEVSPCDAAALAAHDVAHFDSAARALLAEQQPRAQIFFEPAIGPAPLHRYVISLGWQDVREMAGDDEASLLVMAQPVAGGP